MILSFHIKLTSAIGLYISSKNKNKFKHIFRLALFLILFMGAGRSVRTWFTHNFFFHFRSLFTYFNAMCDYIFGNFILFQQIKFITGNKSRLVECFDAVFYLIGIVGSASQTLSFSLQNRIFDKICSYMRANVEKSKFCLHFSVLENFNFIL